MLPRADTPLSERWEALAQAKLRELDELIARAERMKRAIRAGLACGCVRVEDRALGLSEGAVPVAAEVG